MPYRKMPLKKGEFYHVFNRAIERQPIFMRAPICSRALLAMSFYRYDQSSVRLSHYLSQSQHEKARTEEILKASPMLVSLVSYCIMPNHYHFLIRQEQVDGISIFISKFQNSFARYFNDRNSRKGPLFEAAFKVVRIESERQLLHTSRYIHLNPYSAGAVRDLNEVCNYKWSSLSKIINHDSTLVDASTLLNASGSISSYIDFVLDNADYQKTLHNNKHIFIDS